MARFALSAVGADRPGIVAALAEVLVRHQINIEDSQMAILGDRFAMVLLLRASGTVEEEAVRRELAAAGAELGLDGVSVSPLLAEGGSPFPATPSALITVYGVDHPGIVYAVARALALAGVNIVDLQTRLVEEGEQPLYVMLVEVSLPPGLGLEELEALLAEVRAREGVEASVRELEVDVL